MIICQPSVVIIALRESFLQKDELFGHDNQQLSANCSAFALCPRFSEEPGLSRWDQTSEVYKVLRVGSDFKFKSKHLY